MLEKTRDRNVVFTTMFINAIARVKSMLMAAVILAINVYVCRELFRVEYLRHMGSIEGAYTGIAHWLSAITAAILLLLAGRGILKKSW